MSAEVEFFHDRLTRILVEGVPLRVLEVDVRDTAREAVLRHEAGEVAAVALAQGLAAAALLGGQIKGDERITFQVHCSGPLGTIMADYNADGTLRATVGDPAAVVLGDDPAARVRTGLGAGLVHVIKSTSSKELYRGAIPLNACAIEGALDDYFETSEQLPTIVWLCARWDGVSLSVGKGLLLQLVGGGERAWFDQFRAQLDHDEIGKTLGTGTTAGPLLSRLLPKHRVRELDSQPLSFQCSCSKKRVLASLAMLGVDELEEMRAEEGKAEITCNFCRARYRLDRLELGQLIDLLKGLDDGSLLN